MVDLTKNRVENGQTYAKVFVPAAYVPGGLHRIIATGREGEYYALLAKHENELRLFILPPRICGAPSELTYLDISPNEYVIDLRSKNGAMDIVVRRLNAIDFASNKKAETIINDGSDDAVEIFSLYNATAGKYAEIVIENETDYRVILIGSVEKKPIIILRKHFSDDYLVLALPESFRMTKEWVFYAFERDRYVFHLTRQDNESMMEFKQV